MSGAHHHHHHHHHAPADFGRAFAIGTAANLAFVIAEAGAGLAFGSVALLADAGHNLSDVAGLLVAWAAAGLSRRPPTQRFTYGLRGASILAALANALFLMVAVGAIGWEAIGRLADPPPVPGGPVIAIAALGILVNAGTAWLFARGRHGDLNIRGAYLHMAADAAVSAAVVLAGIAIWWTGAGWIDPIASLLVAAVILWSGWGLLRDAGMLALNAVPHGIDVAAVRHALADLPAVARVHHLHIWPTSTTDTALTAHLVMPGGHPGDRFLHDAAHDLEHAFGIGHVTLQVELGDGAPPHHLPH